MTAEEVFYDLNDKYGDAFNWRMISLTNKTFVTELKKEIGKNHFLYNRHIWAVAKCDSNDSVLYLSAENGTDIYYIFHLTYSEHNINGFPKYQKFFSIKEVKEYIEQELSENE